MLARATTVASGRSGNRFQKIVCFLASEDRLKVTIAVTIVFKHGEITAGTGNQVNVESPVALRGFPCLSPWLVCVKGG
jgi:hypothetical protein